MLGLAILVVYITVNNNNKIINNSFQANKCRLFIKFSSRLFYL